MSISKHPLISTIGIVACVFHGAVSPAEDWTQFRGPSGQGHSSARNLPTRWGAAENIKWKSAIPGQGWSSPVVLVNACF